MSKSINDFILGPGTNSLLLKIDTFRDEFGFLSNFYPASIVYNGIRYRSSEVAFQAAKSDDKNEHMRFSYMDSRTSKKEGRLLECRGDWDVVKKDIMYDILYCKFTQHHGLKERLLMTEDAELVEGNTWNDTFWGVCDGVGENHLGKILMKIRQKVKQEDEMSKN